MAVRILAADDSATMRKVIELTFAGEAVDVETVDSGEAALERAASSPPDLVIADASMSMSGYDVARALKSNDGTKNVAVIVLASQHHPFDSGKAKESGVDDHVLKPYDTQAMIDKAQEVLSKPRATATGGAPVQRPSSPGVGKPAASAPSGLRSTVTFGSPAAPDRPVLELADEDPPAPPAPPSPPRPKLPPRPPARKPAAPARPVAAAKPAAPAPKPAAPAKPAASPSAAASAATADMAEKLGELGLTADQVSGVLELSREVIERVVWEVVPDLAEVIIKEEIRRLTSE